MSGAAIVLDRYRLQLRRHQLRLRLSGGRRQHHRRAWGRAAPASRRCSISSPASRTPDRGRVLIGGADVTGVSPAQRPVSMVFQENNLFAHLDVAANVGLGRSPGSAADAGRPRRRRGWRSRAPASPARKARLPREHCRAASASASRSPGRWCATGRCCCSTNRSPRSARRCADDMLDLVAALQRGAADDGAVRHASAGRCANGSPTTSFFSTRGMSRRRARQPSSSAPDGRRCSGATPAVLPEGANDAYSCPEAR